VVPPVVPLARESARRRAAGLRLLALDLTRRTHEVGCTARTRECCFYTWGADAVMPECCVSHMQEVTFFLEDLLTRNGIRHWLDFGSLLGAVRNGELVPWDNDADIGIFEEDFEAVRALTPEITAAGYHVIGEMRILYGPYNWNHVDIWRWWERDGLLETHAAFDTRWIWPGAVDRIRFPRSYVEEFEEVRLYGKAFPAPSPVHEFLREHRYGTSYLTPRRPILDIELRPRIGAGEMTPTVSALVDRVAEVDWQLNELMGRFRLFRPVVPEGDVPRVLRLWQTWLAAGLPAGPGNRVLERSPEEELVRNLALLEQACEELERPGGRLRRTARRFAWLADTAAAALLKRPRRRPAFPFGI
jgi:hypothetical protein